MNHANFLVKWIGKRVRENKALGYQCVALAKQYIREVHQLPTRRFGGSAVTGWANGVNTFPSSEWIKVKNTRYATPQQGDIVFFKKTSTNKYGHVAPAHVADLKNLTVIEQNGERGSGLGINGDEIRLQVYKNYKGVVGWYTPVKKDVKPAPKPKAKTPADMLKVFNRKLGTKYTATQSIKAIDMAKNEYQNNEDFADLVDNG